MESCRQYLFIDVVVDVFIMKITKLRSSPVSPSYPKQVWDWLKKKLSFYWVTELKSASSTAERKIILDAETLCEEKSCNNVLRLTLLFAWQSDCMIILASCWNAFAIALMMVFVVSNEIDGIISTGKKLHLQRNKRSSARSNLGWQRYYNNLNIVVCTRNFKNISFLPPVLTDSTLSH